MNIKAKMLGSCLFVGCLLGLNPLGFSAETNATTEVSTNNWTQVESKQGKCSVKFPEKAEHISETMKIDEDGTELKYDAYISAENAETVFMLLVAEYPDFVDDEFAQMSLEAFLNGIVSHGSGAQLLFSDLVLVQGHEGMDFFVRTGSNYFKGRAVIAKKQLYLMAMECKVADYNEPRYNAFINSFLLTK